MKGRIRQSSETGNYLGEIKPSFWRRWRIVVSSPSYELVNLYMAPKSPEKPHGQ